MKRQKRFMNDTKHYQHVEGLTPTKCVNLSIKKFCLSYYLLRNKIQVVYDIVHAVEQFKVLKATASKLLDLRPCRHRLVLNLLLQNIQLANLAKGNHFH